MKKKRLKIAPSTINGGGNGVFACRDYAPLEFICIYHGHCDSRENRDYAVGQSDGSTLYGYRERKNSLGVGQFINDGSKLDLPPNLIEKNPMECLRLIDQYNSETDKKENINFLNNTTGAKMYAVKPILKGGELFFKYGASYWISQSVKNCKDSKVKQDAIKMSLLPLESRSPKYYLDKWLLWGKSSSMCPFSRACKKSP